ncbi:hypothetical protein B5P22_31200 [Pseudomonas tolaasii]|nr:hypothetical protein B5P22_31200 [Pseudomonas tolaasii]
MLLRFQLSASPLGISVNYSTSQFRTTYLTSTKTFNSTLLNRLTLCLLGLSLFLRGWLRCSLWSSLSSLRGSRRWYFHRRLLRCIHDVLRILSIQLFISQASVLWLWFWLQGIHTLHCTTNDTVHSGLTTFGQLWIILHGLTSTGLFHHGLDLLVLGRTSKLVGLICQSVCSSSRTSETTQGTCGFTYTAHDTFA